MDKALLLLAIFSIVIGFVCGGLVVFTLFIYRHRILASSLSGSQALAGRIGIVKIPFDYSSRGKIQLQANGSTREVTAITDYPHAFVQGDEVLVVQIKDTQAWVVPANFWELRRSVEELE